ncbi:MAG: hypothetical protein HY077_04870 [Elusimicrobia bacterium]|nr:hypothetical protein [Elusimicrobiota bacterium]
MKSLATALLCALAFISSCRYVGNHAACRAHADSASCRADPRCFPVFGCEKDPALAPRCSADCSPYINSSCWINVPNRPDGCMPDFRGGRFNGCLSTDKDPKRCETVPDDKGGQTCLDHDPACAGCRQKLSFCDAHPNCVGVICI